MQHHDLERAQQLLEEANARDIEITIKVWKDQSWRNTATTARDMLNQAGFNASVEVFEFGTFWDDVTSNNEFDAFVLGWTGLTDPDQYMYSQFHTGGSWNWMGYSNDELDSLLEEGRTTTDQSDRAKIYKDAQKLVAEEAVYACLANKQLYQASRADVSGYELLPTSSLRLKDVQIE
jgi:peptide/nickel transport system substrate-binding protein